MQIPETVQDRVDRLRAIEVGGNIEVPALEMPNWSYAMRKASARGDRYFFSRANGETRLIWRHS